MTTPLDATALVTSESGAADQSRRDLQAKLTGLGGLGGRKLSPEAREKKLREACEGFESVFIQKMWQEMRNTIPKGGLMHGKEERFWQDMYDQELSKSMTSAGGIGLADMMYAQLSRNLVSASRSAAGASQSRAFAPEAAPLLDAGGAEREAAPSAAATTAATAVEKGRSAPGQGAPGAPGPAADIYDGAAPGVAAVKEEAGKGAAPATAAGTGQTAAVASAAGAPGAQTAGQEEAVELNPEVERALAALRARQALLQQGEAGAAPHGAAAPAGRPHAAGAAQRQRPMASSGIELAQVARREAGDKLGSHAVRPPLHQPSPRHAADGVETLQAAAGGAPAPAAPAPRAVPVSGEAAPADDGARAVTEAATAQAAGRQRNVRFSTNMRPQERAKRGLKPIRVLNVDNVGVNSKAGAGIAAYHAASEAQAGAPEQAAQPLQQGQPAATGAPAQPQAPARDAAAAGNFTIPPLTAADARG